MPVFVSLTETPVVTFLLPELKDMLEVLLFFIVVGDSVVVVFDIIAKEIYVKMITNFLKHDFLITKLAVHILRMGQLSNLIHDHNILFSTSPYLLSKQLSCQFTKADKLAYSQHTPT